MSDEPYERELPRTHDAPWLARQSLGEWYRAVLEPDALHRAKLLASELVTNAILHGRGRIVMRAVLAHRRMRVEVIDEGDGFDHRANRRTDPLLGRGLAIVDAEASRWGVHAGTTRVWFELPVGTYSE